MEAIGVNAVFHCGGGWQFARVGHWLHGISLQVEVLEEIAVVESN